MPHPLTEELDFPKFTEGLLKGSVATPGVIEVAKNHLGATITVFTFMSLLSIIGEKITQRTLLGNGDVKL